MMLERIRRYIRNRSRLNLAGDILFVILLVLLIIPGPRRVILSNVIRIISFQPSVTSDPTLTLTAAEYSWNYLDEDGITRSFEDLGGEVILLNHWATWCPHCVAELPSLVRLYDDYKDRVTFLFLSYEDPEVVREFLAKRGVEMPFHTVTGRIPEALDTRSLPRTFIIGPDRKIYLDKTGAAKWDGSKTRDLLDELISKKSAPDTREPTLPPAS